MYIVTDIITLSDWKKVPAMIYLWLLSAHILHVHRQTLGLHRQMFPLQHFFFHQINRWVVKLQPRINRSRIFFHILLCCFDIRKQWLWDFQLWTYENRISINVRKIHSARLSLRRAGITSLLGPVDHSPLGTCLFFWPVVLQGRKVLIINLIKIYIYYIHDRFIPNWMVSFSKQHVNSQFDELYLWFSVPENGSVKSKNESTWGKKLDMSSFIRLFKLFPCASKD